MSKPFKLKSQSAVKKNGFKHMGSAFPEKSVFERLHPEGKTFKETKFGKWLRKNME